MTDLHTDQVALDLTRQVEQAIIDFGDHSERSKQSINHILGVSDIGGCREYVRRMILNDPFTDHPTAYSLASFVGHAVGDYAERALTVRLGEDGIDRQMEVTIRLDNGIVLRGHPDLVTDTVCIDFKTVDGLGVVRKGARAQHRWQVTLYTAALILMGRLPQDALCALVYIDRSGKETTPHVEVWRYDPSVLAEIVDWIDDVIYALANDEETSRDKPREFCYAACPYVTACRGGDTDVTGLIEDEEQVLAVKTYLDAAGREKQAKRDRESASAVLSGVNGSTGEHSVRWVNVPEQTIETFNRKGYQRLNITPIKSRKPPQERKKRDDDGHDPSGAERAEGPTDQPA
jgi:hypothetical protein